MFSKSARFAQEKPSDVPPPGFYNPKEVESAPYKKGAFLEKSDRYLFGKTADGPGPSDYQMMPSETKPMNAHSRQLSSSTSAPNEANLRQQIQALQAECTRLGKERQQELQKAESKLSQSELKIKELVREKLQLQSETSIAQKEQRLAVQREAAARVALDKAEGTAKQSVERVAKYNALQRRVEDLEKLHSESKQKYRDDKEVLEQRVKQAQDRSAEQQVLLDKLRSQNEADERRLQELKRAHAMAEKDNQDLRNQLQAEKSGKDKAAAARAEVERLESKAHTAEARFRKEIGDLQDRLQAQESLFEHWKQEAQGMRSEVQRTRDELSSAQRALAESKEARAAERRKHEAEEARLHSQLAEQARGVDTRNRDLETEIKVSREAGLQAKAALEDVELRAAHERAALLGQLDHVRAVMAQVATQYGKLLSSSNASPAAKEQTQMRRQHIRLESALAEKDAEIRTLNFALRRRDEENDLLTSCLRDGEETEQRLLSQLRILQEQADRLSDADGFASSCPLDVGHDSIQTELLELRKQESDIMEDWLQFTRDWTNAAFIDAEKELNEVVAEREGLVRRLCDEEKLREQLEADLSSVQARSASAEISVTRLTTELAEMKDRLGRHDAEEAMIAAARRAECDKLNDLLSTEKEYARRLGLDLAHSKAREAALGVDIETLQDTLLDAARYETAYTRLLAEVRILVSRNALAEDEAEQLSRFNAEILGHTNPSQKILYVDKIRRELAEVKQNLITAVTERDTAEEQRHKAMEELSMYKSVAIPIDAKPRSGITRVVRVPFGSRSVNTLSKHAQQAPEDVVEGARSMGGDRGVWVDREEGAPLRVEDLS